MRFLFLFLRLRWCFIQCSVILPHIWYVFFTFGLLLRLFDQLIVLSLQWNIAITPVYSSRSFIFNLHKGVLFRFIISFRVNSSNLVLYLLELLVFCFLGRDFFLKSCEVCQGKWHNSITRLLWLYVSAWLSFGLLSFSRVLIRGYKFNGYLRFQFAPSQVWTYVFCLFCSFWLLFSTF